MLAYDIYYMDIITFVYKMSLFCPHNEQVHSAFCARKYVLASIFCGYNANSLVFFVDKRHYSVSWFRNEFIEAPNCGIIPKERALGDENITFHEKIPAVAKNPLASYGRG